MCYKQRDEWWQIRVIVRPCFIISGCIVVRKQLGVIIIHPHMLWTSMVATLVLFLSRKPQTQHYFLWTKNTHAHHQWAQRAAKYLTRTGFLVNRSNHCLWILIKVAAVIALRLHRPSSQCLFVSELMQLLVCSSELPAEQLVCPTSRLFHCGMFPDNKLDLLLFIWQDRGYSELGSLDRLGRCRAGLQTWTPVPDHFTGATFQAPKHYYNAAAFIAKY